MALSLLLYGELLETDFMLNQFYFQKAYIYVTIATVVYLMVFPVKTLREYRSDLSLWCPIK